MNLHYDAKQFRSTEQVERAQDRLDKVWLSGRISSRDYDLRCEELEAWDMVLGALRDGYNTVAEVRRHNTVMRDWHRSLGEVASAGLYERCLTVLEEVERRG